MTIAVIAAVFCIFANLFVALFQAALALGAPMGEYAWGGRNVGVLPKNYRLASGLSALVLLAISGHYASVIGWLPSLLNDHWRAYSLWALTAFFALSFVGNLPSKSKAERKMFIPISGAILVANLLILVFYRIG